MHLGTRVLVLSKGPERDGSSIALDLPVTGQSGKTVQRIQEAAGHLQMEEEGEALNSSP